MSAALELRGFVLASASPRRLDLLAGIMGPPIVRPASVDESPMRGERPRALVERLARTKATHVVAGGEIALGADTVVVVDDDVLGKPTDAVAAARMLRQLSGRSHHVLTGVAVADHRGDEVALRSGVALTEVRFAELSSADIDEYIATGDPFDKAGGYGIQSGAGRFVEAIVGRYDTVVGLPLDLAVSLLGLTATLGPAVTSSARPSS